MPWTSSLTAPIVLKSGIKLRSLGDGRDLFLTMSERSRAKEHWQSTFELLLKAASNSRTELDVARAARKLSRALETDRLI